MPKRTLTLVTLTFRRDRKRVDAPLDDIEGFNALHLFHGLVKNVAPDYFRDEDKETYLQVESVQPAGSAVLVVTESGHYGEAGKTIDVHSHEVAHDRTSEESATTRTRTMLIVPPKGTVALFMMERQGMSTGGPRLAEAFKKALLQEFDNHYFPMETVVEKEAWLKHARLMSVTAVAYKQPVSLGSGVNNKRVVLGNQARAFQPPKGKRYFPDWVWKLIRSGDVAAAEVLGFEDVDDLSDLTVQVEKDGQTKTFVIGNEKTPPIRELLNDDGQPPMTDDEFVKHCWKTAKEHYATLGLSFKPKWKVTKWSAQDLAVELPAR